MYSRKACEEVVYSVMVELAPGSRQLVSQKDFIEPVQVCGVESTVRLRF